MKLLDIVLRGHQNTVAPYLTVELLIDNQQFFINPEHDLHQFKFAYDDTRLSRHYCEIKVTRKIEYLTQGLDISAQAYIIDLLELNGQDAICILEKTANYYHTTNGESGPISEPFTNWLGYDGSLKFTFITPVFLWVLLDFEF